MKPGSFTCDNALMRVCRRECVPTMEPLVHYLLHNALGVHLMKPNDPIEPNFWSLRFTFDRLDS